ncbi:hypothetical protein O181_096861, partial [Austropuccinia psidii MF-1]|nr:hypothetical protein [Austropuccinia psidii MF-1]
MQSVAKLAGRGDSYFITVNSNHGLRTVFLAELDIAQTMEKQLVDVASDQKLSTEISKSANDVDSTAVLVDSIEERKAIWRLDISVLPILSMFFLLNFLDRANLGSSLISF